MSSEKAEANSDYSPEIVENIKEFLDSDDWKFEFNEEKGSFNFGVTIDSNIKNIRYFLPVREDGYTVYAVSPINADNHDKDVMREMSEFICRANYGIRNGNFELDMRDGEIRYKVFVDCENITLSQEVIKNSIVIPSIMFERYSPGMIDIMFRGIKAEEAIIKCE